MALVLAILFGALATSAILRRIAPARRSLWAVFVAYVWMVPLFGYVYYTLYRREPTMFVFSSEIAATRAAAVDRELAADEHRLRERIDALRELSTILAQTRRLQFDAPGAWDETHLEGPRYRFDIQLGYLWHPIRSVLDGKRNQLVSDELVFITRRSDPLADWHEQVRWLGPEFIPGTDVDTTPYLRNPDPRPYRAMVQAKLLTLAAELAVLQRTRAKPPTRRPDQWSLVDFIYFSVITQATDRLWRRGAEFAHGENGRRHASITVRRVVVDRGCWGCKCSAQERCGLTLV